MKTDKTGISIRKATVRDIETLINYRIIFLAETYGDPPVELDGLLRLTLRKYFERTLKDGTYIAWIAEYEDNPVGFSGMVIREQPGNFDVPNGRTGYILNIFTPKEFRKKGIASLLMQKLIDEGKRLKLDRLELKATKAGEPIYRQLGFVEPHDLLMELDLR
jgi:GNAT superfamily N-acetyltransferase